MLIRCVMDGILQTHRQNTLIGQKVFTMQVTPIRSNVTMETVQLEKEIRYLKDVVEVEKARWGNDLKITCNLKVENGNQDISPFLLLPFIENAFKHVSRLPFENGYVTIEFAQQNNTLTLLVENSKSVKLPEI